ncbi:TetR family transcriptional regulator [Tsuneonella sp. HG222]
MEEASSAPAVAFSGSLSRGKQLDPLGGAALASQRQPYAFSSDKINWARRVVVGGPRKGEGLSLDRIVEESWRLVDRDGIDGLSTRKLAAALVVMGPALYWHVRNKRHLMSLMIEQALFDTMWPEPKAVRWWEWLQSVGCQQRASLLSHRDIGMIASRTAPTEKLRDETFKS